LTTLDAFQSAWSKVSSSPAKAVKEFAVLGTSEPGIADLAAWARATALGRTDPTAQRKLIDSLAEIESPVAQTAREAVADLRYPDGAKPDTAEIPALRQFLEKPISSGIRARLRRRLLDDLLAGREFADAQPLALELLGSDTSLSQLRRIAHGFQGDTTFLRSVDFRLALARALLAGDPDSSLEILDSLRSGRTPTAAEWILRGRVQLELGDADAAMAAFRHGAEDPREEQALLWVAKGLEKVGRAEDARTAFGEYAHRWPKAPKAQEWLWGNGMDAEKAGKCEEATGWYERVKAGGGRRADWARFREGYCWYRSGNWERAEKSFAKERTQVSMASQREASWFFLASALREAGKADQARAEFAALSASSPWSFHGHLARRAIHVDSAFIDSLRKERDTGTVLWPGERRIALERADTVGLLRLLCAKEIGDDRLSAEVSRRLDETLERHGEREFALVRWLRALGMEQEAGPRLRKLLGKLPPEEIARLPKSVLREFYPMPYEKEAMKLLKGDTLLDPAFVHSVMRQESGYDRFAKSGAGAVGLLQLIPSTARAMARATGMKGFSPSRLTEPEVNLRLGIAYLHDLGRMWKGRLPLVLANYNAGPGPTLRWSPAFDTLPVERAVEEITYWETRDYVKKCMGNFWTYRLLYPEAK
jgi:soluble lytic murein transglycosylase-like protein